MAVIAEIKDSSELFFGRPKRLLDRRGKGIVFEVDDGREIRVWGFGEKGQPRLPEEVIRAILKGEGKNYNVVFRAVRPEGKEYWRIRGIEKITSPKGTLKVKTGPRSQSHRQAKSPQDESVVPESPSAEQTEEAAVSIYLDKVEEKGFSGFEVYGDKETYGRVPLGGELSLSIPLPNPDIDAVLVQILVKTKEGKAVGLRSFAVGSKDIKDGKLNLKLQLSEGGTFQVVSPSTGRVLFQKVFEFRKQKEEVVEEEYATVQESVDGMEDLYEEEKVSVPSEEPEKPETEEPSPVEVEPEPETGIEPEPETGIEPESEPSPELRPEPESEPKKVSASQTREQPPKKGLEGLDVSAIKDLVESIASSVVEKVFREYQEFENVRLKLHYLDLAFRAATDFTEKQFQVLQLSGIRLADPSLPFSERVKALMDLHNSVFERNFRAFLSVVQEAVGENRMDLREVGLGKGQAEKKIMEKFAGKRAQPVREPETVVIRTRG